MAEPIISIDGVVVKSGDLIHAGKKNISANITGSKLKYFSINGQKINTTIWTGTIEKHKKLNLEVCLKMNLTGTKTKTYSFVFDTLGEDIKRPFQVVTNWCNWQAGVKSPESFYKHFHRVMNISHQYWGFWAYNRNCATEIDTQPVKDYKFLTDSEKMLLASRGLKTWRDIKAINDSSLRDIENKIKSAINTTPEKECRKGLEWSHHNHEYVFIDLEHEWMQLTGTDLNGRNWWYGGVGEYNDDKAALFKQRAKNCIDRIKWIKAQAGLQSGLAMPDLKYTVYMPGAIWDYTATGVTEAWRKLMFENFAKPISEHVDLFSLELYPNNVHQPTPDDHVKVMTRNLEIFSTLGKPLLPIFQPNLLDLKTAERVVDRIRDMGGVGCIWWANPGENWEAKHVEIAKMLSRYNYTDFK